MPDFEIMDTFKIEELEKKEKEQKRPRGRPRKKKAEPKKDEIPDEVVKIKQKKTAKVKTKDSSPAPMDESAPEKKSLEVKTNESSSAPNKDDSDEALEKAVNKLADYNAKVPEQKSDESTKVYIQRIEQLEKKIEAIEKKKSEKVQQKEQSSIMETNHNIMTQKQPGESIHDYYKRMGYY